MDSSSLSNPSSCGSTSMAASNTCNKNRRGGTTVKLSTDPQSVAARQRRHRISDRFKILQSLVPGGSKLDTVSMLEEAIQYVKFLKTQIWLHQAMINFVDHNTIDDDPIAPIVQPSNSAVLPFCFDQNVDLCDCYVPPEMEDVRLPESWFSGEENGSFHDAYNLQF